MLESIRNILEPIADMHPIGSRLGNTQKWQDYQAEREAKSEQRMSDAKQRLFEDKRQSFEEDRMNRERENWKTLDEQQAKGIQQQDINLQRSADARLEQYYRDNETASVQSAKNSIRNIPAYGEMPNDVMREEIAGSKAFNDYKDNIAAVRSFLDAAHLNDPYLKKSAILNAKKLGYDVNEDDNGEMWIHNPNDQYGQSIKATPEVLGEMTRNLKANLEQEMKLRSGMKRAEESLVGSVNNRMITSLYDLQPGNKKSFTNAKKEYDSFVANGKYTPEEMRINAFASGLKELDEKGIDKFPQKYEEEFSHLAEMIGIKHRRLNDKNGTIVAEYKGDEYLPHQLLDIFKKKDRFGSDFSSMAEVAKKQKEAQELLQQKRTEITAGKSAKNIVLGNQATPKQMPKSKETIK